MIGEMLLARLESADLVARIGRIKRILLTYLEADGPVSPLGSLCTVQRAPNGRDQDGAGIAEVVGVTPDGVVLAPFEGVAGVLPGAKVTLLAEAAGAPVGDSFLGRAVDALGRPIDGGAPVRPDTYARLDAVAAGPLDRISPRLRLDTGLRAIDAISPLAVGQRVGIFAASGVGKSTLLGQLVNQVDADACVVCLVGERGREVEHLWTYGVPAAARARTVLVAATSDQSAALRVRACSYAVGLADHWRAQGRHVLLVLDSMTRYAMALREVGLAAGEPPTVRAYTPGVFAALPRLVERCGAVRDGGAITAVFTVLSETDDVDDPISETMRSILDGHIVLSRDLAERGHFPAIDAPRSISRLARVVQDEAERALAERAVALLSTYETSRTLIETGVYVRGANAELDAAIEARGPLMAFLRQASDERTSRGDAATALSAAIGRRA